MARSFRGGGLVRSATFVVPRGLRVRVVGIGLVGLVMADHTARRSAELAVASHVAGNAADDGAFDAPLGLRRRNEGECEQASRGENHFHGHSPRSRVRRVKSLEGGLVPRGPMRLFPDARQGGS